MIKKLLQLILFLTLGSCIDTIDLELGATQNLLVVDGYITDEEKAHVISLSRSLPFDNTEYSTTYYVPEQNASVKITDDLDTETILSEIEPGRYATPGDFKGVVGRTYRIQIETSNGNTYASSPEKLVATPDIDSIVPTFEAIEIFSSLDVVTYNYGFEINVSTTDLPNQTNYYRWTSSAIIEYHSNTEVPEFLTCWYDVPIIHDRVQVSDDRYLDGKVISQPLGVAPYERATRIRIDVRQYSMSEKAFNFWNQIGTQQRNSGSIFDPPPATFNGNMFNTDDDKETVLGYFGASAVKQKYIVFDRFKVAGFFPPPNPVPMGSGDCLTHVFGATNVRPEGF